MSNELAVQERAVRIARVKMRGEQLATMETQYVLVAAKTGEDLLWLKANCEHGEFKTEFAKEFPELNYPRATQWMKIAKEFPELLDDSKVDTYQHLKISQAIYLLGAPDEIKDAVIEKIENGEDISAREILRLKKEAADLLASKQALTSDLMAKVQRIDDLDRKVSFQKLTVDEIEKQNDQLRHDLATKVESKVEERIAESRALLILENQQAIAEAKRIADNAKAELASLKKENEKAIKDGVSRELRSLENEIDTKQHQIDSFNKRIEALREVELSLEREVGYLQTHKKVIEKIKDNLSFLTVSFSDAFDTNCIPNEVFTDWQSISYAVSKLNKQLLEFVVDFAPLESSAIVGELL